MTNDETNGDLAIRHSNFVISLSFDIRTSSFRREAAFTIIELLVVITIIIILAGLILGTAGYVQKKGARSRAETEIAAMSAACESYKADNGVYPSDGNTVQLDARQNRDPSATVYLNASLSLYKLLSGDTNANRKIDSNETRKSYISFKPNSSAQRIRTKQFSLFATPSEICTDTQPSPTPRRIPARLQAKVIIPRLIFGARLVEQRPTTSPAGSITGRPL
jgi:type II secretory pathway pseudopilin PulG